MCFYVKHAIDNYLPSPAKLETEIQTLTLEFSNTQQSSTKLAI
jgi:hypothetical protein